MGLYGATVGGVTGRVGTTGLAPVVGATGFGPVVGPYGFWIPPRPKLGVLIVEVERLSLQPRNRRGYDAKSNRNLI